MLRYASYLSRTPADVPSDVRAGIAEVFTPAQVVELTACIAWENYRARFNRGFDIAPQDFSEGAVCALPERDN